ncbi:acyltransferase [Oceanobacillus massiliensis]|uniref:acyltransferase n=1 Tax=Oceanobacillus massiliensis TaxID=1465765 RepID=UPI000287B5A6|nr:acyltransferase [Oceanobacillus massiliensis]
MERNYSIDFVKFFAIFAVVCIHTGTLRGTLIGNINGDDIDFIIDILARFAVPFFFVTSGYLFLQKMKGIEVKNASANATKIQISYFKNYSLKLIKLWAAWFLFYFMFDLAIRYIETEKNIEALKAMFLDLVSNVFTLDLFYYGAGHSQYHLWFLLALIWSVFILFIFYKWKLLPLLVIISFGFNIYGVFGQSYSFLYEVTMNTRDPLFFGLFYTTLGGMLGMYAHKVTAAVAKIPSVLLVLMIISLGFLQVIEAYITLKINQGNAQDYFLMTIPLSIVLFLTVMKHRNIGRNSLISKIGSQSVGIYVSHVFVMEFIRIIMTRLELNYIQDSLGWKLLFTPVVFIFAYLMYMGIQHLKSYSFTNKKILVLRKKQLKS